MNLLQEYMNKEYSTDELAFAQSEKRWASIAKPLNSLGKLEKAISTLCGIFGTLNFDIKKRCVVVFCSDNGICSEGVTQTGAEVTAIVARNIANGKASINHMAGVAGADVFPIDVGMLTEIGGGFPTNKQTRGTKNFTKEPAMTREHCQKTIIAGIELVKSLQVQGYRIIATGEMGIGNTTTSAAIASVLLGVQPSVVTGVGAGLSSQGLKKKVACIEQGILVNQPNPEDALDVLHKLGGYDIAAMVGVYLGGMIFGIPIIVDGFISSVAALVACRICPQAKAYMLPSHTSKEPGGRLVLDELGFAPMIDCEMCLGEGTGAVAVLPLLDMSLAVFRSMPTFDDIQIESYQPLS